MPWKNTIISSWTEFVLKNIYNTTTDMHINVVRYFSDVKLELIHCSLVMPHGDVDLYEHKLN